MNQGYWHGMGLPKRGLSRAGLLVYLFALFAIVLVILALLEGPGPVIVWPFLGIAFAVYGIIMYWTYSSNKAFKKS